MGGILEWIPGGGYSLIVVSWIFITIDIAFEAGSVRNLIVQMRR